jgi:hypothetical protein
MKELMKKILTSKKARNVSVLNVFLMSSMMVMAPWQS